MTETKEQYLRAKLGNFAAFAREKQFPEKLAQSLDSTEDIGIDKIVQFIQFYIIPHRDKIVENDHEALQQTLRAFGVNVDLDEYAAADVDRVHLYLECFCEIVS